MIVEERKGNMGRDEIHGDQFPIGMRVLAVDDDPICLKVLETLLLRCQYHVTTTNQAIQALNMLRENKDKFDLVISDVHMPDMDGFKLLELVGLEMDLPVIMLSANGETKAVMKGITHGACDYLLKPVRIEELRNIWQHVVRRRKLEHKDHHYNDKGEDHEKVQAENSEGTQAAGVNGQLDRTGKVNKKRKDQNDEDEDDCEENTHDNEDPSSQKKPRVVWSVELHRKFVAAVNQLGIDKAVPKRILDLMNVEKLTRENVASHLQKYRLYLKRISAVASQQANMAAALGGRDASYLHMGSFNGYGSYHGLSPSGQLQGLTTFSPNGVSGRTNSSLLGLPGLAPGMAQLGNSQNNACNSINDPSKIQHVAVPPNQLGHFLHGIPTSLGLDQLQQKQKRLHELNNRFPGGVCGAPSNTLASVTNNSLLLQGHQQQSRLRALSNQPSVAIPSIISDCHEMSSGVSTNLPDLTRFNETLQTAPTLSAYHTNSISTGIPNNNGNMSSSNMGTRLAQTALQMNGKQLNISSNNLPVAAQDSVTGRNMQCPTSSFSGNALLIPSGINVDPKYFNFRIAGDDKQISEDPKQQSALDPNFAYGSTLNSTFPKQNLLNTVTDCQNRIHDKRVHASLMNQSTSDTPFLRNFKIDKAISDNPLPLNEESTLGTSRVQAGFVSNDCNFDELMNAMIKPERDGIGFVDGEIGSDIFPLSTCM